MGVSILEGFSWMMHEDLTCNSFDAWGFNFQVVKFGIGRFIDAWGQQFISFLEFFWFC